MACSSSKLITVLSTDGGGVSASSPGVMLNIPESELQGLEKSKDAATKKIAAAISETIKKKQPKEDDVGKVTGSHPSEWLVYICSTSAMRNYKCTMIFENVGKPENFLDDKVAKELSHSDKLTKLLKTPLKSLNLATAVEDDATVGGVLEKIFENLNDIKHSKEANPKDIKHSKKANTKAQKK